MLAECHARPDDNGPHNSGVSPSDARVHEGKFTNSSTFWSSFIRLEIHQAVMRGGATVVADVVAGVAAAGWGKLLRDAARVTLDSTSRAAFDTGPWLISHGFPRPSRPVS
jgi:hypothetical protein